MLNAGSKGQYQRRASAKMLWNGVPEIVVPSWYTSRTCPRHGHIAERHHRQGEHLHLPCCQRTVHADEHAADVIAGYPVLQPLTRPARL
jgi:transposase